MQKLIQNSRHLILVGFIALLTTTQSLGQVITRVLSPDDQIENYIPWYNPDDKIPIVRTPLVDVEAVLQEDERTGREMPRIGIKQEVDFSTEDGQLIQRDNYSLWNLSLYSENAKSLSVRFDNTYLPDDAIMFLYNEETRFIIGPIEQEDFRDGTFRSDYLNGDHIDISLMMANSNDLTTLDINVSAYDHGILGFNLFDESFDDDFNDSAPCNVKVACVSGLECQDESVCKIIHSSIGSCTGSLVYNDCCDLTPFILTANHCTTVNSVDDYIIRFNYQSPQCTPNGETTPSQWVVYFGAELRANWAGNDFSLLELIQDIDAESGISFSGWDRTDYIGSNTSIIHHPLGDVKKITYDDEPAAMENDESLNYPPNLVAGRYVRIELSNDSNGDFGIAEGGTSGGPYFNDENRIFAQHRGGPNLTCTNTNNRWAGRFNASWNGNGTNTTRLRNWLGASTNPNTMDCMENPFVVGPDIICTASELFRLNENMPCTKNITWQVEPTSLFSSSTSGSGIFANLQAANSSPSGNATLTYTLSFNGCNDAIVEQEFWVGVPADPTFFLQAWYDPFLQRITLSVPQIPGATSYNWTVENQTYNKLTNYEKFHFKACPSTLKDIRFSLTAVNDCGASSTLRGRIDRDCDDFFPFKRQASPSQEETLELDIHIFPNPATEHIQVKSRDFVTFGSFDVSITSISGEIIKVISAANTETSINISDLQSGIYIVSIQTTFRRFHHKFVKS